MMMIEKVIAKAPAEAKEAKKIGCTNVMYTHITLRDSLCKKISEKLTDAFTALDQLTFRFKGPNSFIMFIQ